LKHSKGTEPAARPFKLRHYRASRWTHVSHVDRYRLDVDVAGIRDLSDGREQTIAIRARPMFVGKVY